MCQSGWVVKSFEKAGHWSTGSPYKLARPAARLLQNPDTFCCFAQLASLGGKYMAKTWENRKGLFSGKLPREGPRKSSEYAR